MTTMFVQLRGVVYLLVLLQCVAFVSHANTAVGGESSEGPTVTAHVEKSDEDSEAEVKKPEPCDPEICPMVEKRLAEWIRIVDDYLADGRGCRSVWDAVVNTANETSKLANTSAIKVGGLVKKIEEEQTVGDQTELVAKDVEILEDLVRKVKEAVDNTRSSVLDTWRAEWFCGHKRGTLEEAQNGFKKEIDIYIHERVAMRNETYWTIERVETAERSNKTYFELQNITKRLKDLKGWSQATKVNVEHRVKAAKKQLNEAKEKLEKIKPGETLGVGSKDEGIKNNITNITGEIDTFVKKIENWRPNKNTGPKENSVDARIKQAIENEKKLVEQEKETDKNKRIEERAQREREAQEQKEREVQAQRAREAQEQKEREAQAQKTREAQEQKDREVQAQKAREAQEQKEREVRAQEAKDALEKTEKEQLERAAEEARKKAEAAKKNDNSVSPALVHVPLLLLLVLTVLGSTLVC
ncbi:uncharacterized protein TM35_000041290 [Trypanosoma theileri]|uniref:Transglutaminase n=1 Tax=Trypanosoma theileri TaxID=67003 RepID=A0A1X0P4W6_9TRYP|nr:uncharacterized protein TM35_000041290 [Trypanosoma theileri]ORC91915.1 hypothetical protein TM35_000041290 [Trypanosoma theileri]